jgi:hypothetical protein
MRQALVIMAVAILHHSVLWGVGLVNFAICGFASGCHPLDNVIHFLLLPYSLLNEDPTESELAYLFNSLFWGACAGFFFPLYARQRSATNIFVPVLGVTIALLGLSAFVVRQESQAINTVERARPRSAPALLKTDPTAQLSCRKKHDLALERLQSSREFCDESRVDCGPRCFPAIAEEWSPDCKVVAQKNVCIPNG